MRDSRTARLGAVALIGALIVVVCVATYVLWSSEPTPEDIVSANRGSYPVISEFYGAFPEAFSYVSHARAGYGPRVWNSTAPIHGRYVLTLQFEIEIDKNCKIVSSKQPMWYLREVSRVDRDQSGRESIYYGHQEQFGADRWYRFIHEGRDVRVLGVDPRATAIPGFESIWRRA